MKISELLTSPFKEERRMLTVEQKRPYPRMLYKYRTGEEEYLPSLLIENELYLASRHSFNDPMDVMFHALPSVSDEARKENILRIVVEQGGSPMDYMRMMQTYDSAETEAAAFKKIINHIADTMGIFSFAETPRNLLMWAHYAHNHEGVCFQYYLPGNFSDFENVTPVNYSNQVTQVEPHSREKAMFNAFCSKSIDWQYEEEWRIIKAKHAKKKISIQPGSLIGIIYGARCTKAIQERIKHMINERVAKGMNKPYEYDAHLAYEKALSEINI